METMISSSCGECIADPAFGFVFNNYAFENFNEREGTIANNTETAGKKISGNSRSIDTFATDICNEVKMYEKRLKDVSANMTYIVAEKTIYVEIKGVVISTGAPYIYKTTIRVWR